MNPFDLLPPPQSSDAQNPAAIHRWLYMVWLKLRNSYNSMNDVGIFMNTLGVSSISTQPDITPSPDPTALTFMEKGFSGEIDDTKKQLKQTNVLLSMTPTVDLNEAMKIKRDMQTLIFMGGN